MNTPTLKHQLEQHIESLPVLPMVVAKLMALNRKSDDFFDDVLKLVESAPAFSARLLALSNSAAMAPRSPITTIRNAIARVGSQQAADLILADGVTQVFVPRNDWEKSLWRHDLQVANAARALAQAAKDKDVQPDEAYAAGLLHDIGRFVMFQLAPEELRKIDEGDWDSPETLVAVEKKICGLNHGDLGALAGDRWKLPTVLIDVVRHHHRRRQPQPRGHLDKLIATVQAADFAMFPSALPRPPEMLEEVEDIVQTKLLPRLPEFLRLPAPQLTNIITRTTIEVDAQCVVLGLG